MQFEDSEEEYLDPIILYDFTEDVDVKDFIQLEDEDQIHPKYEIQDVDESIEEKPSLPVVSETDNRNNKLLKKCCPLSIKVVDYRLYPWYYKNIKFYNIIEDNRVIYVNPSANKLESSDILPCAKKKSVSNSLSKSFDNNLFNTVRTGVIDKLRHFHKINNDVTIKIKTAQKMEEEPSGIKISNVKSLNKNYVNKITPNVNIPNNSKLKNEGCNIDSMVQNIHSNIQNIKNKIKERATCNTAHNNLSPSTNHFLDSVSRRLLTETIAPDQSQQNLPINIPTQNSVSVPNSVQNLQLSSSNSATNRISVPISPGRYPQNYNINIDYMYSYLHTPLNDPNGHVPNRKINISSNTDTQYSNNIQLTPNSNQTVYPIPSLKVATSISPRIVPYPIPQPRSSNIERTNHLDHAHKNIYNKNNNYVPPPIAKIRNEEIIIVEDDKSPRKKKIPPSFKTQIQKGVKGSNSTENNYCEVKKILRKPPIVNNLQPFKHLRSPAAIKADETRFLAGYSPPILPIPTYQETLEILDKVSHMSQRDASLDNDEDLSKLLANRKISNDMFVYDL